MELSRRQALLGSLAVAVAAPAAPTFLSGSEFAKLICQTQPMKDENPWAEVEWYGYSYVSAILAAQMAEIQKTEDKVFIKSIGVEGLKIDGE